MKKTLLISFIIVVIGVTLKITLYLLSRSVDQKHQFTLNVYDHIQSMLFWSVVILLLLKLTQSKTTDIDRGITLGLIGYLIVNYITPQAIFLEKNHIDLLTYTQGKITLPILYSVDVVNYLMLPVLLLITMCILLLLRKFDIVKYVACGIFMILVSYTIVGIYSKIFSDFFTGSLK